ncbi:hypothetical protein [Aurantiacibacter spongiae]|uniref:Uncharacterized protein n=1 Tax=Aurantiacibacter spongiae TaxID=2488860 RepID=A0A3N5CV61_9SPHN|nr:hypothetical protein [Aurantiacibacter spongiae]RPF72236.1 hypothetical protein EG799_11830 [Aurantiacibacter spongiae]
MSKPLAIAAAFSILAMSAFALCATPAAGPFSRGATKTGATMEIAAPALDPEWPGLAGLTG